MITGIGRRITCENIFAVGYWKDDIYLNGYGKMIDQKGVVKQGLWDYQNYLSGSTSKEIKSYNPNIHICSKMIDYD